MIHRIAIDGAEKAARALSRAVSRAALERWKASVGVQMVAEVATGTSTVHVTTFILIRGASSPALHKLRLLQTRLVAVSGNTKDGIQGAALQARSAGVINLLTRVTIQCNTGRSRRAVHAVENGADSRENLLDSILTPTRLASRAVIILCKLVEFRCTLLTVTPIEEVVLAFNELKTFTLTAITN